MALTGARMREIYARSSDLPKYDLPHQIENERDSGQAKGQIKQKLFVALFEFAPKFFHGISLSCFASWRSLTASIKSSNPMIGMMSQNK